MLKGLYVALGEEVVMLKRQLATSRRAATVARKEVEKVIKVTNRLGLG
jgi:hypothetical protein